MSVIETACSAYRQFMASREQLTAEGVTTSDISRAVRQEVLVPHSKGVFGLTALPGKALFLLKDGALDPGFLAHARDVLLSLGPGAAAAGRTAAALWCFDMLREPTLIEVLVGRSRNRASLKGVEVTVRDGVETELREVLGFEEIRVLTALETVLHCGLELSLREAVVIADSALRNGALSVDELVEGVRGWHGKPGATKLRRMLSLVDPESGSVLESLLRVLLAEHGLRPESQLVLDKVHGGRIGRVDFAFLAERLVVECDGHRWHNPEDARTKDRLRDNELERAGWSLLRVTWDEVVNKPDYVVELVQDCLAKLASGEKDSRSIRTAPERRRSGNR